MPNLPYKNPITPLQVFGNSSVERSQVFGTNFSVLGTGGFMEVYTLDDLIYKIPSGYSGNVEITGNTIPIQFKKGSGSVFSPDVLTLNSDNISSGRRRLGMLVYVYETDKIYQFYIHDYNTLWSAATNATGPGGPSVIISEFGTTIKNNTPEGQSFINSWTASTIEGVSGVSGDTASWRLLNITGGTGISGASGISGIQGYSGLDGTSGISGIQGYIGLDGTSGISGIQGYSGIDGLSGISGIHGESGISGLIGIGISGISGLKAEGSSISAFTYNPNTFTITDLTGGTFSATINIMSGLTVNGNLTVTGTSHLDGTIISNNLSGSTDRLVEVDSTGLFSAIKEVIPAYIPTGSTAALLLNDDNNWDINGDYIGVSFTGTYQGQKHVNGDYFFEAVDDNLFIRLIRG